MKNFRRLALYSSLTLLVAAIPATVLAAAHGPGFGPGRGPGFGPGSEDGFGHGFMAGRMAERLGLSADQLDRIRAIHESYRGDAELLMETTRAARLELGEAIHADVFDEIAIRDAAGRLAAAEADLAVLRARVASDVRQVLTPEQAAQARELRERMHELAGDMHRHHGPRGRWGHRGPDGSRSDGE